MNLEDFQEYKETVFRYRYQFFLLAFEKEGNPSSYLYKYLEYRYRAETDTFDPGIVEDLPDVTGERIEKFVFEVNALHPEVLISEALEEFRKDVLVHCKSIKEDEIDFRANFNNKEIFENPPGLWDYYKKQDVDPDRAANTFKEWDRLIAAYRHHLNGMSQTEILNQMINEYLPDSDQSNRLRKLRNDLEKAHKLVDSTIQGTFPFYK